MNLEETLLALMLRSCVWLRCRSPISSQQEVRDMDQHHLDLKIEDPVAEVISTSKRFFACIAHCLFRV